MMRIKTEDMIFLFRQPLFLLYSGLFSLLIFVLFLAFSVLTFSQEDEYETYLEKYRPTSPDMLLVDETSPNIQNPTSDTTQDQKQKYDEMIEDLRQKMDQKQRELSWERGVKFAYYPNVLENYLGANLWVDAVKKTIESNIFSQKDMNFLIELYKKKENMLCLRL